MTDMSRRDLDLDTMAYQVAHEALDDAGVSPHELGLVIVGNAMAGRLSDQGCVRGQTWLRKAGLSEAAIINVDNSCAGGSSALHLRDDGGDGPGPPGARARRREDVDRQPRRDDRGHRGRVAGGVPPRPARAAPRRRQPGGEHPHGAQQRRGRSGSWPRSARRCARSPPRPSRRSTTPRATRWRSSSGPSPSTRCSPRPRWPASSPASCAARSPTAPRRSSSAARPSRSPPRRPVSSVRWRARETARSTTTTG